MDNDLSFQFHSLMQLCRSVSVTAHRSGNVSLSVCGHWPGYELVCLALLLLGPAAADWHWHWQPSRAPATHSRSVAGGC